MTAHAGAIDELWIRRFHSAAPDALPLVFFPHAGGGASSALRLSRKLAPAVQVLALQYPGRQDRRGEDQIGTIHELADSLAEVLGAALGPSGRRPYAFFGHSMGAVLAFEVARRFAASGRSGPRQLIVSARRAPSVPRSERHHLLDDQGLLSVVRSLSGTDHRVFEDPELVALALPTLRADYRAIETYAYRPDAGGPDRLASPLTLFTGADDPETRPAATLAEWARHTTGPTAHHVFPGGHFYLDGQPAAVAAAITTALRLGALLDPAGSDAA
ncbi:MULTISPECIES: thioesterase II family protein [unclassified Streptomyces]|uniref:thioesterase II family protein n=1 Tax=unclassified Streptomyces TaxID=2593676 RepID=UPI0036FE4EEE